jgi:hypothetical protein
MNGGLPGWIVGDADSVRAEAASYREMTVDQRQVLLAATCRAAARLLRNREDVETGLARTDPLPASTIRALARLRREAGRHPEPAVEHA